MKTTGKSAFTLIELIVVIGIIGILMGVALSQFGGSTASAKAAKCETNMRNLVTAAHTCALTDEIGPGWFPCAESYSLRRINTKTAKIVYDNARCAWISGSERRPRHSKEAISFQYIPFNTDREDLLRHALTNGYYKGEMWKAMGATKSAYQCPVHVEAVRKAYKQQIPPGVPGWSYAINYYFGSDKFYSDDYQSKGKGFKTQGGSCTSFPKKFDNLVSRDPAKLLMFAELPALSINEPGCPEFDIGSRLTTADRFADAVLDPWNNNETIGFNHKTSSRGIFGHVAFTDGHVEKLLYPRSSSALDPLALTKALCAGHEVSFVKGGYADMQPNN